LQMCCIRFGGGNSDHTPQIRSLGSTIEIIEVRSRNDAVDFVSPPFRSAWEEHRTHKKPSSGSQNVLLAVREGLVPYFHLVPNSRALSQQATTPLVQTQIHCSWRRQDANPRQRPLATGGEPRRSTVSLLAA
jgi:hypothetical protein